MLVNGVQYKEHHTALCRGYVSVKNNEEPKPYVGIQLQTRKQSITIRRM